MPTVTRIVIDFAKNVFEISCANRTGKIVKRARLKRDALMPFLVDYPAVEVILEACGSAHNWGRQLQARGHSVRLLPVQHVARYRPKLSRWAYSADFFRNQLFRKQKFDKLAHLLRNWEVDHLSWDANDLLAMLWVWQHADISDKSCYQGDYYQALAAIRAKAVIMPCLQDKYFSPQDNAVEITHLRDAELRPIDSPCGHTAGGPGRLPAVTQQLSIKIALLIEKLLVSFFPQCLDGSQCDRYPNRS